MSAFELRIPPPLVGLCVALLMWLASRIVPHFAWPLALRGAISLIFVIAGIGLAIAGVKAFAKAKTTVNPTKPAATSSLVVTGVYRFTRNPMYLGMLLVLLGWAAYLANVVAFLLVPLFVLYITRFQIIPEERVLAEKFGAEFTLYKARVHRWL
jgi:protein-S-isoprenylcysteine O-methyltransferase Ste14